MTAATTEAQEAWVERVLGIRRAAGGPGNEMANWKARREAVVASLKAISAEIAAQKHPSSTKAIIEIQAVIKNLTPEPASLQQVKELQTYIDGDQVVNDVSELAEDIRTPLLGALSKLSAAMDG
jgi:hypothetical protein